MTRMRQRELSQQMKDEQSELKGLAVLEKDFDGAEAIAFGGQTSLKSAAKDLENEINGLRAWISAREQCFRNEKEKLEKRVIQLQSELSVSENRYNELNSNWEIRAKVTRCNIFDYEKKVRTLYMEIIRKDKWIWRQDEDLKSKDERIKRQDEHLLSKDKEIKKMNAEKEKTQELLAEVKKILKEKGPTERARWPACGSRGRAE